MPIVISINRIIFPVLLLLTSAMEGQFFGVVEKSESHFMYQTVLTKPNDGKLRAYAIGQEIGCCPTSSVLVFDQNLQQIETIRLPRGFRADFNEPLYYSNSMYWPTVYYDTLASGSVPRLCILKMDSTYHYLNTIFLSSHNGNVSSLGLIKVGTYFFSAYWYRDLGSTIVYKLNSQFTKIDSLVYNNLWNDIRVLDNCILTSFSVDTYSSCLSSSWKPPARMKCVLIDTLFNNVSCRVFDSIGIYTPGTINNIVGIFNPPFYSAKVVPITKVKYLATGFSSTAYMLNAPFDPYNLYSVILDKNHSKVALNIYGNSNKNITYFNFTNFATVRNYSVATTGVVGYDFTTGGFVQTQKTRFFINKVDSLGVTNFALEYGGNMFYRTQSICSASDGGWLVAGVRYDTLTMGKSMDNWESFLFKVDSNGNYASNLSLVNQNIKYEQSVKVVPNPARTEFAIKHSFFDQSILEIFDCFYKVVLTNDNYVSGTLVEMPNYPAGVYYYKLQSCGNIKWGKIVLSGN